MFNGRTGEKVLLLFFSPSLYYLFPRCDEREGGVCWRNDGFQGRIFVLFLLTVPRMRNRCCYFKISPYLNLLLPFLPSPRLICRSVAEGFSLMTLLGRRSESRHISRFQFPFSLSLHFYLSLSLYPPPPLSFLLFFYCTLPPSSKQHHSSAEAKMPADVVSVWPEAWRYTACLIEDKAEGKRGSERKNKRCTAVPLYRSREVAGVLPARQERKTERSLKAVDKYKYKTKCNL